jgi:hypothetical protein
MSQCRLVVNVSSWSSALRPTSRHLIPLNSVFGAVMQPRPKNSLAPAGLTPKPNAFAASNEAEET